MKVVIMAGGKGTRISSLTNDIPKPLLKVGGRPVLELEIECLKKQSFNDFIITVSYMADKIMDYFGDGSRFGVKIAYFIEEEPLGNAGALFKLREQLKEDFLLLNADVIFDIDVKRFVDYHKTKGGLVTLFTHPNNHPYDSGLLIADEEGRVLDWLTKEGSRPKWYQNRVNAGLHIISPKVLDLAKIDEKLIGQEVDGKILKVDLDRQLLKPLAGTGLMYCYDSPEYVKDMGTPKRYYAVNEDYLKGKVQSRNLKNKQRAIFLDRDGTINKYVGFLRRLEDFELLPASSKGIRKINESGYLAIVITNQPVIARGEVSYEELREIHNKMETLLGEAGA
ncbi:NTP transferase domain-containing protein, partial [bacterium]|nr:NTP transferase domain-containing protein [bacterium]